MRAITDDDLGMPPLPASEHMFNTFIELGPCRDTGMGPEPWGWQDLDAFSRTTLRISEPWEFETLVRMSRAYIHEFQTATSMLTIPPTERGAQDD